MVDIKLQEVSRGVDKINQNITADNQLLWIADQWKSNQFQEYIESIPNQIASGDIIYDKRNLLVRIPVDENLGIKQDVVIKKFKLTRKYDQLRFRFLKSKAIRSLKLAMALEKIGINTPKPIAVIEKRDKYKKILYSYFICEYVDYNYNLLDIVKDDGHPLREKVKEFLPQIAQDIRKMHDAGVVHYDLHAGNILVKNIDNPEFYYIDLNRGRIKKKLSRKARMKDLARFKLTATEEEIFINNYEPQNSKKWLELMRKSRARRKKIRRIRKKIKKFI
ncbi:lipopolysaccharide kinase InaA family protein [Halonatronum saccharophilum]|uniref:lipopolysaccharide kinase InaA family protein n=1 Tax=Halonatronum saccharophilum TaxID=150060 RepID=UPI0004839736|nr:lipopolysaccharide kinase InaA family protein [Halonatronum saccharophilum]